MTAAPLRSTAQRRLRAIVTAAALLACLGALPAVACEPLGYTKTELLASADAQFAVPPGADRDKLALALVECLGNVDPILRDAIGYTGLAALLRAGDIDPGTVHRLRTELIALLEGDDATGDGFLKPWRASTALRRCSVPASVPNSSP